MENLCDNLSNLTVNSNIYCVICKKQNNKNICDICNANYVMFVQEKCVTCGKMFVNNDCMVVECDDCEKRYGGLDMYCDA